MASHTPRTREGKLPSSASHPWQERKGHKRGIRSSCCCCFCCAVVISVYLIILYGRRKSILLSSGVVGKMENASSCRSSCAHGWMEVLGWVAENFSTSEQSFPFSQLRWFILIKLEVGGIAKGGQGIIQSMAHTHTHPISGTLISSFSF